MSTVHRRFKEFGLSNYAGWEVVDIWHRCKEKGWVLPTVYQGMCESNSPDPPLTRVELIENDPRRARRQRHHARLRKASLPPLRRCGVRFYGYNPLAGGLLTGK